MIPKKTANRNNDVDQENDMNGGVEMTEILYANKEAEADYLSRQGDYVGAIPFYSAAIKMKPSVSMYLKRSRCLAFIGDMNAALKDAESAFEINPSSLKVILCKAECYYSLGNFESALVWYSRGINHIVVQKLGLTAKPDSNECDQGIDLNFDD